MLWSRSPPSRSPRLASRLVASGNVFGDQQTMKERIREQKRMVERSVRGLERDRANLERDEKKLIAEIKVNTRQQQQQRPQRRHAAERDMQRRIQAH